MRLSAALLLAGLFAGSVVAKLPPPSDEAKATAAEAAAKSAWSDKVGLYQLCRAQDRVAASYRKSATAAAKVTPASMVTQPCADPGPYASPITPAGSKPLEAAGAHSPPGLATSPPNTKTPAAEIPAGAKK